ncbi:MAG: phosphate butyryltransferase, partial [Alloprevotella sp.]|nr:phosphate butyryltransferase [Alloprevotella sp.]
MESIKNFRELTDHLAVAGVRKRAAVVCGTDRSTQEAVLRGLREGFLDVIFVGGCGDIREAGALVPYARRVTYVEAATPDEAARAAVAIVREGGADIL